LATEQVEDMRKLLPSGHGCCPGCQGPVATKMILRTLGRKVILFGSGGCGDFTPKSVPYFGLHFSGVGTGATGILAALEMKNRKDITVISLAGDGATGDIGFGKLAAIAERNDNMIHFCYDNEAYMNTGIQKSGLTPFGAWTTTTPAGKTTRKKDVAMALAAMKVPYVATVTVAYRGDFQNKVKKAAGIQGFKYIHVLEACPTGWRVSPEKAVEVLRLAVQSHMWNLYEIENGIFRLTMKPKEVPVKEYFQIQGRFRHLKEDDIQRIQKFVDEDWARLKEWDGKSVWVGTPWRATS
jgi:pyruvate ferredoxin oxidoreductase beta subunit